MIAREAGRLIGRVTTAVASLPTLEERVASAFAATVEYFRSNPLFNRILALEADTVLPRLTTFAGPLLASGCAAVVRLIQQAQHDGLISSTTDAESSAEIIVRILPL